MAIKELTSEQVRTMSLEEKDRWWLTNVFKGNAPQLNLRSALTGVVLGCVLSLTNLYVGIKTGWTLGVGVTSVILSYSIFKLLEKLKVGKEMSVLENNAMQSIATSAGYMTSPLMASLPAYMMVTGHVIPMWEAYWWMVLLSVLGVLFAFPLKKRFINDDQLPFPEGYAAGVVMDNLHSGESGEGVFKAKLLAAGAAISAFFEVIRNETFMAKIHLKILTLPEYWDEFVYKVFSPHIFGSPLKDLTVRWETSIVMMGTGGLMSMKTAMSLLIGAIVNYIVLAPLLIKTGVIPAAKFKDIAMWSMWGGAAMMTTASLYSFFSKPQMLIESFTRVFSKDQKKKDVLEKVELPMWVFVVGIPIVGALTVWMGHVFFGIHYWLGVIAIPLVFVFTLIAVTSTGLTAITPGGALGKLTQITYSVIAPGNIPTNLMTAGITSEVSLNASNLLMDIKPGYMLGAKPRQQAVGHVLGIFAGGVTAVYAFYYLFHGDISMFTTDKMPLPGALVWKAVSEVLGKGLSTLHPTAQLAVLIGGVIGIALEIIGKKTHGKFPLTGVGLGLGFVLQFFNSLSMALGALFFWVAKRRIKDQTSLGYKAFVENQETLCAGVIAGGSIIGIILALVEAAG